jgi:hypothetical protein
MKTTVTIVEMEHHFLYLPVYFARDKKFFAYTPADYDTRIVQAAGATDVDTYRRLSTGEADLAICDPSAIVFGAQAGFIPHVLGGLVIRGAFWAVDTNSPDVSEIGDLAQFGHIVTFLPGTTAHGIACRIVRSAKGEPPIIDSVRPLQELTRLEDLLGEKKSAVALTPDVLRIERSLEANKDWLAVKLALADTLEYGHLLVTAVLARPDFVRQHPTFVKGFLKALQRSLMHASAEDPAVLAYAEEAFNQPREIVARALRRANDAQVWASSVAVTEDLWLNAVQAHYDSIGQIFDEPAKRNAQKLFAQSFKPQIERARRASLELLEHEGERKAPRILWREAAVIAASIFTGICFHSVLQGGLVAQLGLALGIMTLTIVSDRDRPLIWNSVLLVLFGLVWTFRWKLHIASEETYIGTLFVLLILFAEGNFKILRRHKKGPE